MGCATRESVKSEDDNSVEFPLARVAHQIVELRPRVFGSRFTPIDIFANDDKLASRAVGAQIAQLHFAALVFGGDTGVNADFHTCLYARFEPSG